MKYRTLLAAAIAAVAGGCGGSSAPGEAGLRKALDAHFAERGNLCLNLDIWGWPKRIGTNDRDRDAMKLRKLAEHGLLTSRVVPGQGTAVGLDALVFELSDASIPFRSPAGDDLCWGRAITGKVLKWDVPAQSGPQATVVTFTYGIEGMADWAKDAETQTLFRDEIATVHAGAGTRERRAVAKLTSNGWEVEQLLPW